MSKNIPEHCFAVGFASHLPARRLFDCRQRYDENYSRKADQNEGELPRFQRAKDHQLSRSSIQGELSDQTAANICQSRSQHHACGKYIERQIPLFSWKIVCNQ
jgi:alpha-D-ribose 1-methylphosphonate 5-triphosphate diphosphatase PhnM